MELKAGEKVVVVVLPDTSDHETFVQWLASIQPTVRAEVATYNGFGVFYFKGEVNPIQSDHVAP